MTAPALGRPGDVVVGIAEMRLSVTPGERLVTYALGSCLGVAIHDPVAGGAHAGADEEADQFRIGTRNVLALRKLLWKNGVLLRAHDLGGRLTSRTMRLDVASGALTVRTNGHETTL